MNQRLYHFKTVFLNQNNIPPNHMLQVNVIIAPIKKRIILLGINDNTDIEKQENTPI